MSDLVFTTQGQAETLAAQEAVAKKGREIRDEFEAGAKSVGAWDAAMSKLKGSAESALRSVATEQEKIAQQIDKIALASEKGLIPPAEAEAAVARLKDRWLEADEATKKQAEDAQKTANAHELLKESAEHAIESVATESEKTEEKIKELGEEAAKVREAMKEGLIPPGKGEETLKRLKEKMEELKKPVEEVEESGGRMEHAFKHLFDPAILIKSAGAFIGIHAAIHLIKEELEDIQVRVDKRVALLMKPAERQKFLDDEVEARRKAKEDAAVRGTAAERALGPAHDADEQERVERREQLAEHEKKMQRAYKERGDELKKEAAENDERERAHRETQFDHMKTIQRANQDYIRNPGIESQRRVADARQSRDRMEEDFKRDGARITKEQRDQSLKWQQGYEDMQRQRDKQQQELELPGASENAARVAAVEANADREKADRELLAAQAAAAEHKVRPGVQEALRLKKRGEILDKGYEKAVESHPTEHNLNDEEIAKVADMLRELGEGVMERKIRGLIGGSLAGTSEKSVIDQVEARRKEFLHPTEVTGAAMPGGGVAFERPPTEAEKKHAELLAEILTVLRGMSTNGGMVGGAE